MLNSSGLGIVLKMYLLNECYSAVKLRDDCGWAVLFWSRCMVDNLLA